MPLNLHTLPPPLALPPWKKLGRKLESACRKALFTYNLLGSNTRIGIALSGGKDSLTLLYLLHALSGRGFPPLQLYAFHVSGAFSCGSGVDRGYLKAICEALKIPLIVKYAEQKLETLECYSCSRLRRKLLFDAARAEGITTLAFGHHREDQIQTLLMNLLHKGEFAGLLPKVEMVNFGITIIRPLIYISEKEIQQFAKEYGFARMSCQCPVGQNSMRKQVERLIHSTEELFPNIRGNLAHASLVYGSDKAIYKPENCQPPLPKGRGLKGNL